MIRVDEAGKSGGRSGGGFRRGGGGFRGGFRGGRGRGESITLIKGEVLCNSVPLAPACWKLSVMQ